MGSAVHRRMITDEFTDRILGAARHIDIVIHDGQLIGVYRFVRVGNIAMKHIEQAAILRDHDAVAIGVPGGGDHAHAWRDDLAPGEVVIRAVRKVHRGQAGVIFQRFYFYQHYGYKEDLYEQMVARATERIREALMPVVPDASGIKEDTVGSYARRIIAGIAEVRDLIYVMLKGDDGTFLRQLTDLIFGQNLSNALPFFDMKDSMELRLFYEFQSAGMAAFIIKWVLEEGLSESQAAALLTDILLQPPAKSPKQICR